MLKMMVLQLSTQISKTCTDGLSIVDITGIFDLRDMARQESRVMMTSIQRITRTGYYDHTNTNQGRYPYY